MLEITLNYDHKAMTDESVKLCWSFRCGGFSGYRSCCCLACVFVSNEYTET